MPPQRPQLSWFLLVTGVLLPGAGQLALGQWLAAALVLGSVLGLWALALADMSLSLPLSQSSGLMRDALTALRHGRVGPQAQLAMGLAAATHLTAALLAHATATGRANLPPQPPPAPPQRL